MDLKSRAGRREQGDLIKAAASAAGLTLKELAGRLGVSHALIYQYVSGANLAQPDKLQEIAHLTGLPVAYFFGESSAAAPAAPGASTIDGSTPAAPIEPVPTAAPPAVDNLRLQQNLRQLEILAQAQDRSGRDLSGLLATLEQMLGLARLSGDNGLESELLLRIGNARTDAGELQSARAVLEECLALCLQMGLEERTAGARQSLARCCSLLGDLPRAAALFEEVAASPNPNRAWRGLLGLGQIFEQQDEYDEALALFERARDTVETLPADERGGGLRPFAELYVRTNLGNVYMAEGDFATALPLWQENVQAAEQLSQPDQFIEALLSESICYLHLGRAGAAHRYCERGVRLSRLLGDQERLAVGLACFAEILAAAGLAGEGIQQAREALRLAGETGSLRARSFAHLALARNFILAGQLENADFYLQTEVTSAYRKTRVTALLLQSESARRGGAPENAVEEARAALHELENVGALHLERAAWAALAQGARGVGNWELVAEAMVHGESLARLTPGLADTSWLLEWAEAERLQNFGDVQGALARYDAAIEIIMNIRKDLAAHEVLETCLDDPEKLALYRSAIALAREAGEPDRASAILEEAAWPPLLEASAASGRETP